MKKTIIVLLIGIFAVFSLIQSIPNYSADTQSGFILASTGKDGQWGTSDDIFATEKGDTVKGAINTIQYNFANSIPSNSSTIASASTNTIKWNETLTFDILPENLNTGWSFHGVNTYRSIADGILHFQDTGTGSGYYAYYQLNTQLTSASHVIVETRIIKVVSNSDGYQPSFEIADGTYRGIVKLYPDHIVFSGNTDTIYNADMTIPHVIRLEKKGNSFSVYFDGIEVISNKTGMSAAWSLGTLNRLQFGHGSSTGTGESYWDYYRYAIIKN
ncbi:hypothetical protein [Thermoanaerobacter mathranii]|uniref:hypothetical protein n=1 Tax=Thermoanaerobacter mathranii TaxID=583357 RepID=UPI003D6AA579